jgi:hypothetical protein
LTNRSSDGNTLFVCSTDGYCTIASFADCDLGKVFTGNLASQEKLAKVDEEQVSKIES